MTHTLPRLRILNDYEVVVAGLRTMLEPFADRIRVVETDAGSVSDRTVEVTLYDTFGNAHFSDEELRRIVADPDTGAVVVYTWNGQRENVQAALDDGCRGYLDKTLPADQLVAALERVAAGEVVVDVAAASFDSEDVPPPESDWPGREVGLTVREAEAVALITQGATNAEIAERMFITTNSLKSCIRGAYRKMGVERRSQAVRWGIEHGMSLAPGLIRTSR